MSQIVNICLRPSRLVCGWIVGFGVLLLWPIWFSRLPWWLCLCADTVVLVWLLLSLRRHCFQGDRHLSFREGGWQLQQNGSQLGLTLIGEIYSNAWLTVVKFRKQTGGSLVFIIAPDSASADERRQLRVLLRHYPQNG